MAERATYVALLRGVNVGGNARIRMADLREVVGSLGHGDVATYIQSGNVVFTAETAGGATAPDDPATDDPATAARLASGIHDALKARLDLDVDVMVRSRDDLERTAAGVPFPVADPKRLIVAFLSGPPSVEAIRSLEAVDAAPEQVRVAGRVAYLDLPNGVGQSVLAPLLERRLGVRATARNLRTVQTLVAMMGGSAGPSRDRTRGPSGPRH